MRVVLVLVLIVLSSCAQPILEHPKTPIVTPEREESVSIETPDKAFSPEPVTQPQCAGQSWPPDCEMIPMPEGVAFCKRCKELDGGNANVGEVQDDAFI